MNKIVIFSFSLLVSLQSIGQVDTTKSISGKEGYLEYKIYSSNSGIPVKPTSIVKLNFQNYMEDSLQFDSRTTKPEYFSMESKDIPADYIKIFMKSQQGDSIAIHFPVDSLTKMVNPQPHVSKIQHIHLELVSVFENNKVAEADQAIELKKAAYKDSVSNVMELAIENKFIDQYVSAIKLTGFRTSTGLYVVVKNKGTGKPVVKGNTVKVNYTGKTMDGKVFDSNTDIKFGHVTPLDVAIGSGAVIKGWEEGLTLFNKGGEGMLIIPSTLGWGKTGFGPSIGPNTIVVFDVAILNTTEQPAVVKPVAPVKVIKPAVKAKTTAKPKAKH